jgi:hypothetical protein
MRLHTYELQAVCIQSLVSTSLLLNVAAYSMTVNQLLRKATGDV